MQKPVGLDQEITLGGRRTSPTTIRHEHQRGKVMLLHKGGSGWWANIEDDHKETTGFPISEADFKALGG